MTHSNSSSHTGSSHAPCDDDRPGLIVVVQLGSVAIGVLFAANEVLVQVEVQRVCAPVVGCSRVTKTGRLVVKVRMDLHAVFVSKHPHAGTTRVPCVVVLVSVEQPDASSTAVRDDVVKVAR